MTKNKSPIPYFEEINEFLASTPLPNRTRDPDLYCMRSEKIDPAIKFYKPPFRRAFYFIALLDEVEGSEITYDTNSLVDLKSILVFQSPGLISSFRHNHPTDGYLVYFKPQCFSFFKPDFVKEFPFFDPLQTNFFKLSRSKFADLVPLFEDVFQAYEKSDDDQHKVASIKLLALLYQLKDFSMITQWQERFATPQLALLKNFIQLVNNYYIEKRTVEEYAEQLFVTPKYLSRSIKAASGKNALSFINERIIEEAKSLILYTDAHVAEISYQLNFSNPANFSNFFKKQEGVTPLEFRKQNTR